MITVEQTNRPSHGKTGSVDNSMMHHRSLEATITPLAARQKRCRGCRYRDYDNPALRLFTLPLVLGAEGMKRPRMLHVIDAVIETPIVKNYTRKQFVDSFLIDLSLVNPSKIL